MGRGKFGPIRRPPAEGESGLAERERNSSLLGKTDPIREESGLTAPFRVPRASRGLRGTWRHSSLSPFHSGRCRICGLFAAGSTSHSPLFVRFRSTAQGRSPTRVKLWGPGQIHVPKVPFNLYKELIHYKCTNIVTILSIFIQFVLNHDKICEWNFN